MKAPTKPVKPTRPTRPYLPNKTQKEHKHEIDASFLFRKTTCYDEDGNVISQEQYEADGEKGETETDYTAPSLKDLLDLVPTGTDIANVFVDPGLHQECPGIHPIEVSYGIMVYYTTPYIYEEELKKYNEALKKYEQNMLTFASQMETYKAKMAQYKADKEKFRIEKKKADLEAQLTALQGK